MDSLDLKPHKEVPCVIRTPSPSLGWRCELLWNLAWHRITLRYKETVFGFMWIFLQPVALTIIFTYIFHWFARVPSGETPYPLFAAVGLVAWSLTSLVVSQSTICITSQTALLRRVALPKILLPFSVIIATMADLCVMSILLIILFFFFQTHVTWTGWFWLVLVFLTHMMLLTGVACLVSAANVFLKDVGQAVPYLLQLWFFASPVFYPSSLVPRQFKTLAQWNPMGGLIEGYRAALLHGTSPPWELFWPACCVSLIVFWIGISCLKKLETFLSDLL